MSMIDDSDERKLSGCDAGQRADIFRSLVTKWWLLTLAGNTIESRMYTDLVDRCLRDSPLEDQGPLSEEWIEVLRIRAELTLGIKTPSEATGAVLDTVGFGTIS